MELLKVNNAGTNQVSEISINPNFIVSIQKPIRNNFGCIIVVSGGEKIPVKETYNEVISFLEEYKKGE